jgi:hypothetical protein
MCTDYLLQGDRTGVNKSARPLVQGGAGCGRWCCVVPSALAQGGAECGVPDAVMPGAVVLGGAGCISAGWCRVH